MARTTEPKHWLDLYASELLDWQHTTSTTTAAKDNTNTNNNSNNVTSTDTITPNTSEPRQIFYRRMGIVENMFDIDGNAFQGRADLSNNVPMDINTSLTHEQLRERAVLVWAFMRVAHVLMGTRGLYLDEVMKVIKRRTGDDDGRRKQGNSGSDVDDGDGKSDGKGDDNGRTWLHRYFVYAHPQNPAQAIEEARRHIVFLEDEYPNAKEQDFNLHVKNATRGFDSRETMARMFVLPFQISSTGRARLHVILELGHQIVDGITTFRWSNHVTQLFNLSESELKRGIARYCANTTQELLARLPPAQERLYPVSAHHSVARRRWNWLITRLLRHVRKPQPLAFQNPLRRTVTLQRAERLPSHYPTIFDYDRLPPNNSYKIGAELGKRATTNIFRLCKEAGVSVGSGTFVLVAMVMMRMEEMRDPDTPFWERRSFVGSFPVNPRPFLSGTPTTGKEDSLMLAFSDGVALPFIPSHFDLEKSFKVLSRLAARRLKQYQKRRRTAQEEAELGSRSPTQLLPSLYLLTLERLETIMSKPETRVGFNPQGAYPAKPNKTMATCGVSSVGDVSAIMPTGQFNVEDRGDRDLVADGRGFWSSVRAREGEFLVGAMGTRDYLSVGASYDGCAIDPAKAQEWKERIESLFDYDVPPKPSSSAERVESMPSRAKL